MRKQLKRDQLSEVVNALSDKVTSDLKDQINQALSTLEYIKSKKANLLKGKIKIYEDIKALWGDDFNMSEYDFAKFILTNYKESLSYRLPIVIRNEDETMEEYHIRQNKMIDEYVGKMNNSKGQSPN